MIKKMLLFMMTVCFALVCHGQSSILIDDDYRKEPLLCTYWRG